MNIQILQNYERLFVIIIISVKFQKHFYEN